MNKPEKIENSKWLAMLLCLALMAPSSTEAQETNPLQEFIDSVTLANTVTAPDGTKKVKMLARGAVPTLDLSKSAYSSYKNLTYTLEVTTSIKVTNGTIGAADGFKGDRSGNAVAPLIRVKNGMTLYVDETAGASASNLTTDKCPATVELEGCSTLNSSGDITAPDNGIGVAILLNSDCDNYQHEDGDVTGSICTNSNTSNDNAFYCADIQAKSGTEVLLPVYLNNVEDIAAFQVIIVLPIGVKVAPRLNEEGDTVHLIYTNRFEEKAINCTKYYPDKHDYYTNEGVFLRQGENELNWVCVTLGGTPIIKSSTGIIAYIPLTIDGDMADGAYECRMIDVRLTSMNIDNIKLPETLSTFTITSDGTFTPKILGDVNDDGYVTLADAICEISWLLEQNPPVFVEAVADYNQDHVISVSDAIAIIQYVVTADTHVIQPDVPDEDIAKLIEELGLLRSASDGFDLPLGDLRDYTAFTADITLDDGATLLSASLGTHSVATHSLGGGCYRIVAWSMDMAPIGAGAVLHCKTSGGKTSAVTLDHIRMVDMNTHEHAAPAVECTPTGIREVETGGAPAARYRIDGTRVSSPQRGIYVGKGKKIIVK